MSQRAAHGHFGFVRFGIGPQLVVLFLVLGLVGAMAIQPTRQLLEQRRRISGMAEDLTEIERSNRRLRAQITRLNDPDFLEQRAREEIGLVRPGEITYVVMPPGGRPARTSGKEKDSQRPGPPPDPGFVDGLLHFIGIG